MAGTIIDMIKIKQLLQLKKAGVSNRKIVRDQKMITMTMIQKIESKSQLPSYRRVKK